MARGGKRPGAGRPKRVTEVAGQRRQTRLGMAALRRASRDELTRERVLEELRRIVFFNPQRLFDKDGKLKHPKDWRPEDAGCLAAFEVIIKNAAAGDNHTDTVHKIKWFDKGRQLELAMKHLGLLTDKIEISGDAEFVAVLHAARQRVTDARPVR